MTEPVMPLDPNELDPTGELAAAIEAQRVEYNTYVAAGPIYTPQGVLAYNTGHAVPCSNVLKHGYFLAGQVKLVDGAEHPDDIAATLPKDKAAEPEPDDAEDQADVGMPAEESANDGSRETETDESAPADDSGEGQ